MSDSDSDPYENVALIFAGFICDGCAANAMEHPTIAYAPDSGWERAMAEHARSVGWFVKWPENVDPTVLCPNCRSTGPELMS